MKRYSVYTKPIVVYCLAVLLVLLVLILPIRYTFALMSKYISLRNTLEQASINTTSASDIDESLLLQKADTITHVFEVVSFAAQSNNLIIKQIEPPHIQDDGDVEVQTLHIVLQGEFIDILKCLQFTDAQLRGIKIASIKFNREDNNKRVSLVASIVFRKIQITSNNEQ